GADRRDGAGQARELGVTQRVQYGPASRGRSLAFVAAGGLRVRVHAIAAETMTSAALSAPAQTPSPGRHTLAHQGRQTNTQPQARRMTAIRTLVSPAAATP
ncbi:hypothetical protein ABZ260_09615, partial [Streptosporangium sp. NPDC006013]|uniref:hypothetical protein n=1 Tax=Streptosporangium sp. NPDC006013 TaxID=3155596 RepID=UPI0033AE23F6